MPFPHTKLKNGLTLYVVPTRGTATVTVLVLVKAGSKYETKRWSGLSHFLEHMFFKGTSKRPTPLAVAETLDRVGGEYNAFTDKEHTGYYAKVDAKHLELAVDWVSDMLLHPLLKKDDIEREKGVISQEIGMYYDTPTSYVGDVFEKLLYGDQPAGWDIAGTKNTIAKFTRADFLQYLGQKYVASETTVVVAGNVKVPETRALIARYFSDLKSGRALRKPRVREQQRRPALRLHPKDTDQTHLILGLRTCDAHDQRRYALTVLSTILGGNMSSRLFTSLREKAGLAYYISASSHHYTDTGYLAAHAGVPNAAVVKAVQIILHEYDLIRRVNVSADELRKAKDYIKGKALIGLESSSAMASFVGDQALLYGKAAPVDEILRRIEAVSTRDILSVASTIFRNDRLNLAIIGPPDQEAQLKPALRLKE